MRNFLGEFSKGACVGEAKRRLAQFENEAWANATKTNTVAAYKAFIDEWGNSRHLRSAINRLHALEQLEEEQREREALERAENEAWAEATETNTATAYKSFMRIWPASSRAKLVQTKLEHLEAKAWAKACLTDTVRAYESFKQAWPQSDRPEAKAWTKACALNTSEAYQAFVRDWPQSGRPEEKAWNETSTVNTLAAYRSFARKWPNSQRADLALWMAEQTRRLTWRRIIDPLVMLAALATCIVFFWAFFDLFWRWQSRLESFFLRQ